MATIQVFKGLDDETRALLNRLADRLVHAFPGPSPEMLDRWDTLLDAWIADPNTPLVVRSGGHRGEVINHRSGREILFTDNALPHWCFSSALHDIVPTLEEVLSGLREGSVPVALAFSSAESPRYRGTLGRMAVPNLYTAGWKVCHIRAIGGHVRYKTIAVTSIDLLQEVTRDTLSPRNMFLMPKVYGGLGEVPEVFKRFNPSAINADSE